MEELTQERVLRILEAFEAEDTRLQLLPETEEIGNPFTICTNGAHWLKETFFPSAEIMGYSMGKNPAALIGREIDGHDFLFIEKRYILDFWYHSIVGDKDVPIFIDLQKEPELIQKYYGDFNKWEKVD